MAKRHGRPDSIKYLIAQSGIVHQIDWDKRRLACGTDTLGMKPLEELPRGVRKCKRCVAQMAPRRKVRA